MSEDNNAPKTKRTNLVMLFAQIMLTFKILGRDLARYYGSALTAFLLGSLLVMTGLQYAGLSLDASDPSAGRVSIYIALALLWLVAWALAGGIAQRVMGQTREDGGAKRDEYSVDVWAGAARGLGLGAIVMILAFSPIAVIFSIAEEMGVEIDPAAGGVVPLVGAAYIAFIWSTFIMAPAIGVLENRDLMDCLRVTLARGRGRRLVHFNIVILLGVLGQILASILAFLIITLLSLLGFGAWGGVGEFISPPIAAALFAVAATVVYADERSENMDSD